MHIELIDKIIQNGNDEDMECLRKILISLMDDLKYTDYDKYKKIELKLYKRVYGEHLNEELAKSWVADMENRDGTKGEHWSLEQTNQYAGNYNKYDFYAVANMMRSDYYNPKLEEATYLQMAKDWLDDKDVGDCKTLKYYMYIVK